MSKDLSIPRASTPEEVEVDSKVIQEFLDECVKQNKELHSLMVLRHGKVACEVYREPFNKNSVHMMYSFSKSVTSIATGFAIDEGYFSLETKFLDIFPEFRNQKKPDAYLEELSVEHLLTMTGGKGVSVISSKSKDSWLKNFVNSDWYAEPGTRFMYINECMYVLCCIIVKTTGMSVTKFLTPRLWEPLGIDVPYWETDPRGIEVGGWGLMLKTEDAAKFTLCMQQGGKYLGKQVIPAWWVEAASKKQVETAHSTEKPDSKVGYGYCFWRCAGYENAYRADGMYSQYGIVFEDLDACVITTAGEINTQQMKTFMWEYFPKAFQAEKYDPKETVALSIAPYEKLPASDRSPLEEKIECQRIRFSKPVLLNVAGFPVSAVTMPALYMEKDRAGNINNVSFKFYENDGVMLWTEGNEVNSVHFGLDGEYRWDYMKIGGVKYETCSMARWRTDYVLEVHIRALATVSERVLTFTFDDKNRVQLKPSSLPSNQGMIDQLTGNIKDVVANETLRKTLMKFLPKIMEVVDSKHYGIVT
ncbi:MAG: serine hydrolase [Ruminococcaceae bacterium]|nr:serine hydrolase [Oscillospiraceae bacterium]